MKVKTAELDGIALDWAVAKCEGVNEEAFHLYYEPTEPADYDSHGYPEFHYSTVWAQGGPIIEREGLCVGRKQQCDTAYCPINDPTVDCWARTPNGGHLSYGPTPLIAAMRCYVAGKLGESVEVPEELFA